MIWKALFITSLIANFILGYVAYRKEESTVVERVIIETHPEKKLEEVVSTKAAAPVPMKVATEKSKPSVFAGGAPDPIHESEFQDASEKMETDRREFMMSELGASEETLVKHNKIREEFYKKSSEFWGKNPMRELSFKERRDLLEMEETLHKKLEALHGKANWEKYLKFRETYNQKGFKAQMDDNRPFIFMGI